MSKTIIFFIDKLLVLENYKEEMNISRFIDLIWKIIKSKNKLNKKKYLKVLLMIELIMFKEVEIMKD